jgi:hypothetical protein
MEALMLDTEDKSFPQFHPGPRWYLGILAREECFLVEVREGRSGEDMTEVLNSMGVHVIYVLPRMVTPDEVGAALREFVERGKSFLDSFDGEVEAFYHAVPIPGAAES